MNAVPTSEVPTYEVPTCALPICAVPICAVPICAVPICAVPTCAVPAHKLLNLHQHNGVLLHTKQCDQMAWLCFNIWTFTTMKICPIALKMCKTRFNFFKLLNQHQKRLSKTFKILPKWRNFTKSGRTEVSNVQVWNISLGSPLTYLKIMPLSLLCCQCPLWNKFSSDTPPLWKELWEAWFS